jgi:formylglycine-generating enzyme required for sulfatase activity
VRAYATNEKGTAYGNEVLFSTIEITTATITTKSPSEIKYHSAICGGILVNDGNSPITSKGIIWSSSQNPTFDKNEGKIVDESQNTDFTTEIKNLKEGSIFYVRAFAVNEKGIAYGEETSFSTQDYALPALTTTDVTNIEHTSATSGGNITSDGNNEVTARGIVWSYNHENPTVKQNDGIITEGKGTGEFSCEMTNLQKGTTYHVKCFATNQKGTAYGNKITFTTKKEASITVTTTIPNNVTSNSAISGGAIEDNDVTILLRGVVWDTDSNPTVDQNKGSKADETDSDEFACKITKLEKGTKYFVRAFAITNYNITYGEEYSFVTKSQSPPYVQTKNATKIRYTSAICAGNVRTDYNTYINERGIIYSTNSNFSNSVKAKASGAGRTGDFSCSLENLKEGTMYYYKAYASNEAGTSYGEVKPFLTLKKSSPEISTLTPSDITYSTAICGGNVTNEGSPKSTIRGIIWDTRPSPTVNNYLGKYKEESNLGEYSHQLKELKEATTYYVRAYVTYDNGVVYGEEESFTTEKIEVNIEMVSVEGGTFEMGTECNSDDGCNNPTHTVTVSDFQIGKYEITKGQWQKIMRSSSPPPADDNLPIGNVSWYKVQEFISKLNKKTGEKYRLPTEAEWEFAARGGNKSQGYLYSGSNNSEEVGWYDDVPHPIGLKKPNELGIYDMSGNISEWCSDWYSSDYYLLSKGATNPKGPKTGQNKVTRAFNTARTYYNPDMSWSDIGFRLVLETSN